MTTYLIIFIFVYLMRQTVILFIIYRPPVIIVDAPSILKFMVFIQLFLFVFDGTIINVYS